MRTASSCCAKATSPNRAGMPTWPRARAGMRASGATSNCRRASMPAESLETRALPGAPAARSRVIGDAAALLVRAATPERRILLQGIAWLLLAAGLEALGPLAGKFLIDRYLLPRNA